MWLIVTSTCCMRIYCPYAMESVETQRRFFRQSVMRKIKASKIVGKFSRKTPNFFDEWKAYLEINFFSFSLISDWFVNICSFAQCRKKSLGVPNKYNGNTTELRLFKFKSRWRAELSIPWHRKYKREHNQQYFGVIFHSIVFTQMIYLLLLWTLCVNSFFPSQGH